MWRSEIYHPVRYWNWFKSGPVLLRHYNDVTMSAMASQISSHTIVYSIVCSGADRRKHPSSSSLAFVRGIHLWPMNSPHKGSVTRKMFPLDDVIMIVGCLSRKLIGTKNFFIEQIHQLVSYIYTYMCIYIYICACVRVCVCIGCIVFFSTLSETKYNSRLPGYNKHIIYLLIDWAICP